MPFATPPRTPDALSGRSGDDFISHRFRAGRRGGEMMTRGRAFTLVETVLALGIVAFAMVGIMGLIPIGLKTFRGAINASVESGIVQRLAGEVQRAETANLVHTNLYFDESGAPVEISDEAKMFSAEITSPDALRAPSLSDSNTADAVTIKVSNRASPAVTNSYLIILPPQP